MHHALRQLAKKGQKNELIWRYGFNFFPSFQYRFTHPFATDDEATEVVDQLNENGIAITSVNEFGGHVEYFSELESSVCGILESRKTEIEELRARADDTDAIGEKTFNVELLGSPFKFDSESTFARFSLQDAFLDIANAYLGMIARLRYFNVWYTFPTRSKARESQLWHFDREDNYILKVFMYLNDVDEGAGPFTYAPKTHRKGALWNIQPEHFHEGGVQRSTDEQMAAVVPKEKWIRATGKKGTIVFADTRGFHKGGEARTGERLMFTCMFTSPSSRSKALLNFQANDEYLNLSRRQRRALPNGRSA